MNQRNFFNANNQIPGDGNQIYSVGGKPSLRISRRQSTNSNVFPAGCMGNNEPPAALASIPDPSEPSVPQYNEGDAQLEEGDEAMQEAPVDAGDGMPANTEQQEQQAAGYSASPMYQYGGSNIQRNPLTGSGCCETRAPTGKRRGPNEYRHLH